MEEGEGEREARKQEEEEFTGQPPSYTVRHGERSQIYRNRERKVSKGKGRLDNLR